MRYAKRLLGGDTERARDVVQESFLRLCREARRLGVEPERREQLIKHADEWLYRVCRNHAIDILRKEKRMHTLTDALLVANESPTPDAAVSRSATSISSPPGALLEEQERRRTIQASIRQLNPRQQELVFLKFESGLSYKQIASITQLSTSNVGYILHTAMRALRQSLSTSSASPPTSTSMAAASIAATERSA